MNDTNVMGLSLSQDQLQILFIIRTICSVLSLVGCLFIIGSMIVLQRFTQMSSRLVFSLTMSALLFAISNLISSGLNSGSDSFRVNCIAQGFLIQFSEISIFAWITTIALNLYLVVCWNIPTNRFEKFYHLLVWSWALVASCVPFVSGLEVYNLAGIWCWFSKGYTLYRFLLFYVPFIIQVLIVLIFYILIIKQILTKVSSEGTEKTKVRLLIIRLRAYPIIFFACYLFPAINRIHDAVSTNDSFALYVLQCLTAPSIGLVNAFAYGFDNDIRNMWLGVFKKFFNPTENISNAETNAPSDEEISFESGSDSGVQRSEV